MSAGLKSTIGFVFAIVVMLIFVVIAESPLTTAATDEVSHTFTSADANAGTVTLTRRNWFNNLTRMTITGATSGSLTATSTIDADRVTLTLNGGLDSENVTVVHRSAVDTATDADDTDDILVLLLSIFPFFMLIGGIASSFFQIGRSVVGARGGGGVGLSGVAHFVVILAGVIMTPIIVTFVSNVNTTYGAAVEFTGVTTVTPLVIVSFLLGLVTTLLSGIAGKVLGGDR